VGVGADITVKSSVEALLYPLHEPRPSFRPS
jgi:hypothetical protein